MKILIPTITGNNRKFPIQLFSPSINKKNNFGEITIIDCHTYFLRNFCRSDSNKILKHYLWYIGFCQEYQFDNSKIIVLPDWDWIQDPNSLNKLNTGWKDKISSGRFLKTKSSAFVDSLNYIGFASGVGNHEDEFAWKHIFSKNDLHLDCELLTFDSQDHGQYNEENCQFAKAFIQNLF